MTKIGIMTFLHNDNYGSTLQAYALQTLLREWGFDCEHIDYRPDSREKIHNLLASGNSLKLVAEGLRKKRVRSGQNAARRKSEAIPDFYRRHMRLSPVCTDRQALRKQCGQYDILICGSDQIWNPTWLNPAYFLPDSEKRQTKIAYAASLGVSSLPPQKKIRKFRKWTADFDAISVRENAGAELMEKITGQRPDVMPDPVCLLGKEEWEALAAEQPSDRPYLLCYFIGENPEYWEKVRMLSSETGLGVRVVPVTGESYASGYSLADAPGPESFLGAICGAAAVCTDSFHCAVFSEILEKPCTVCRRDRDNDPENRNSRIDSFRQEISRDGLGKMRGKGLEWLKEKAVKKE